MKSLCFMFSLLALVSWNEYAKAAPVVKAEVITCSFTEPFFTLVFDPEKRTMIRIEPNWESGTGTVTSTVGTRLSFRRLRDENTGPLAQFSRYGIYEKGRRIMTLTLNYKGSDGMSDLIFPYDAQLFGALNLTNSLTLGGCETEKLEALSLELQAE